MFRRVKTKFFIFETSRLPFSTDSLTPKSDSPLSLADSTGRCNKLAESLGKLQQSQLAHRPYFIGAANGLLLEARTYCSNLPTVTELTRT